MGQVAVALKVLGHELVETGNRGRFGLVEAEKQKIISGKWDVFHGPIKDQSGKVVVPAGKKLSDKEMLSLNWYVEGVSGEMPK